MLAEDDDGAVLFGLVEQFGCVQCALAGAAASVAVDLDFHAVITPARRREAVDAVNEHVVAHGHLAGWYCQVQRGEAPEEKSAVADLHLRPGELLAQALVDPVPERVPSASPCREFRTRAARSASWALIAFMSR